MTPAVCVCICTRGRPEDLRAALASVNASSTPVAELVVSDDGPANDTKLAAESAGGAVRYTVGPARGLAANRNHALALVSVPYVMFLDDDCRLAPDFLTHALTALKAYEARLGAGAVVITGAERKGGILVRPADQSFLGFQGKPYDRSVGLKSVVINSAIFPTALTRELQFDYRLRFGAEEVDLATRLVAAGGTIVYCPDAVNIHMTSPHGRSAYGFDATASRLYATLKRYAFTERRLVTACAFALLAPLHTMGAGLRGRGYVGASDSVRAVSTAARYMWSFISERRGRAVRPGA
jgi:GT2 family glycosyltransferase